MTGHDIELDRWERSVEGISTMVGDRIVDHLNDLQSAGLRGARR